MSTEEERYRFAMTRPSERVPKTVIMEAAERVRVARTMAVARQDEESATELAEALEEFNRIMRAVP